jgi:hypothetical protein
MCPGRSAYLTILPSTPWRYQDGRALWVGRLCRGPARWTRGVCAAVRPGFATASAFHWADRSGCGPAPAGHPSQFHAVVASLIDLGCPDRAGCCPSGSLVIGTLARTTTLTSSRPPAALVPGRTPLEACADGRPRTPPGSARRRSARSDGRPPAASIPARRGTAAVRSSTRWAAAREPSLVDCNVGHSACDALEFPTIESEV